MCGIFGFIGFKKQPFDKLTFLSLGCENDSRGGDGCGVFIDGKIEYSDITKVKLFRNFFENSTLINNTKFATIAIGHDRKASVGGVTQDKLHPIYMTDKNGNINFVMIHNGTLHNYRDLAKKYLKYDDDAIKSYSDSQILAKIIYQHGFGVLSEYIGSAAILIVDYRNKDNSPIVYAYRGESKLKLSDEKETEERPFYFYKTTNGIWFSSMSDYFDVLSYCTTKDIFVLPTNKIVVLNKRSDTDEVYYTECIDRTKCYQQKQITYQESGRYSVSDFYNTCWELPDEIVNTTYLSGQKSTGKKIRRKDFKYYDEDSDFPIHGIIYINKDFQYLYHRTDEYNQPLYFINGILVFDPQILIDFEFGMEEYYDEGLFDFSELDECKDVIYGASNIPLETEPKVFQFFDGVGGKPITLQHKVIYIPTFNKSFADLLEYTVDNGKLTKVCASQKPFNWFIKKYNKLCHKAETKLVLREEVDI